MPELTDLAKARLDAISFFLVIWFASAGIVYLILKNFSVDLPWLEKLTYWKVVLLQLVWSLAFILVLTMISGARELMTPKAWEKQGLTYKTIEPEVKPAITYPSESELLIQRMNKLQALYQHLSKYAADHEGKLPEKKDIPATMLTIPFSFDAIHYIMNSDKSLKIEQPEILAYEPQFYGDADNRLYLMTDGQIVLHSSAIKMSPPVGEKP